MRPRRDGLQSMAFNPSSDVVLDVLNAADPARASMAAERLAALAAGAPARDFARRPRQGRGGRRDRGAAARARPRQRAQGPRRRGRRDRPGGAGEGRVRGDGAELLRRRDAAEGVRAPSSVRGRRATSGARCSASRSPGRSPSPARWVSAGACSPPTTSPTAERRTRRARGRGRGRSRAPTSCPRPPAADIVERRDPRRRPEAHMKPHRARSEPPAARSRCRSSSA